MTRHDLQTHESEYDIQRFLQIREEVHAEIKKMGSHINTLDETTKRLLAHMDVFQGLSEKAGRQIEDAIKVASFEMAKTVSEDFSKTVSDSLGAELTKLNTAIDKARDVLDESMGIKYQKLVFFCFLGCWLFGFAGFGGGYIYAKRTTYEMPEDFFLRYTRGRMAEEEDKREAWLKDKGKPKK